MTDESVSDYFVRYDETLNCVLFSLPDLDMNRSWPYTRLDVYQVPYNQPGPALDMMIRFLRGESFHDRPLVSYSSWHLPEEVGELLLRQSIVSTTKTTLPSAGGTSNSGTVPPGTTMSAVSVLAAMALLVATAFSLGMWVGGRAVAPGGGGTTGRREMRPLKEEDCNYGSI
jgi:hypothetical protein